MTLTVIVFIESVSICVSKTVSVVHCCTVVGDGCTVGVLVTTVCDVTH